MSDLFWLTDEQMARLQPYFPKSHGRKRVDDRRVLSGIIFVNRNGLIRPRFCVGRRSPRSSSIMPCMGSPKSSAHFFARLTATRVAALWGMAPKWR